MGFLRIAAALGGVLAIAAVQPAHAAPASQRSGEPMCRRAPDPVLLPPESPPKQNRWESRSGGSETADMAAMPPPPPPPPPPPIPVPAMASPVVVAAPAPPPGDHVEELVVTGSKRSESVGPVGARGSAFAPRTPSQGPQSGLLTAGDHDDLLNPELYARYVDHFLSTESLAGVPRVDTRRVLTVVVEDSAGRPAPFAAVTVTCADGGQLTLATLADGAATFFPELDRLGERVTVTASLDGRSDGGREVVLAGQPGAQRQVLTLPGAAAPVRRFDLALMVDTTGSMADELEYLKAELRSILAAVSRTHPNLDLRIALVAYRDVVDDYVTRTYPFTSDLSRMQADLAAQSADGGGDYPEAVEQAMARTVALDWRKDAVKTILFVADAPPHADDVASTWRSTEAARAKRIQIVPVGASGVGEGAEYLMRAMAAVTQSRYLFLTDDSGIGNPHAPPAVDCYLVTKLDVLIRRVLDSQISGRRIEPRADEVIRTVGTYDNGRCILRPDKGGE